MQGILSLQKLRVHKDLRGSKENKDLKVFRESRVYRDLKGRKVNKDLKVFRESRAFKVKRGLKESRGCRGLQELMELPGIATMENLLAL